MASMQAEQQGEAGDGNQKEPSDTEHAQKSEIETASSADTCKKQPDIANHPLVWLDTIINIITVFLDQLFDIAY